MPSVLPTKGNTYVTNDGDMLDLICIKHYGRWSLDVLKLVWGANPWLLHVHALIQPGKILILPVAPNVDKIPRVINLWQDSPQYQKGNKVRTSLLTFQPAEEYGDNTLEEYLELYRRNKATFQENETVELVQGTQPIYGTLANDNNEVYRYSPGVGFVGVDRFELKARFGDLEDSDMIEIVVRPGSGVSRYEIHSSSQLVEANSQLMFCAVRRMHIDSIQFFITKATDGLVTESHVPLPVTSYAEFTIMKRRVDGSVLTWGDTKRVTNALRTNAILAKGAGEYLDPGECLIARVTEVRGAVFGLSVDVYTAMTE